MNRYVVALAVLVPAFVAVFVGCAEGTEVDPMIDYLATSPNDAGKDAHEDADGVKLPSTPNSEEEEEDAGAGNPDAGSPDAGGPPGGGGGSVSCAAPASCSGATSLGSVSGDTGSATRTAQGSTSQWFTVRVTEDDNVVFGFPLSLAATLVSPPGTNFDLYVYVPSSDTLECSAVSYQSTATGSTDSVAAMFGELGLLSNGADDSRTVTVEVRHVSGSCDSNKKWTLSLAGNQ
ncbi:MAG TPA: hypothetical protein VM580_17320 [Labilithrix sp.]|nr:hypothetical protein [Labilithrix sp.]